MNLPNQLTILRIILAAVFTLLLTLSFPYCKLLSAIIFIIAAITDLYDGKIARETGVVTTFGKLMDPLADKILTSSAFILFVALKPILIPAWMVIIIISREFLITGIRLIAVSEAKVIPADSSGKIKTIFQLTTLITTLVFLSLREILLMHTSLWNQTCDTVLHIGSLTMVTVTMLVTIYSGANYLIKYKNLIKE